MPARHRRPSCWSNAESWQTLPLVSLRPLSKLPPAMPEPFCSLGPGWLRTSYCCDFLRKRDIPARWPTWRCNGFLNGSLHKSSFDQTGTMYTSATSGQTPLRDWLAAATSPAAKPGESEEDGEKNEKRKTRKKRSDPKADKTLADAWNTEPIGHSPACPRETPDAPGSEAGN